MMKTNLYKKLILFQNKRDYLEKHPNKNNIKKLEKIYQKINLLHYLIDKKEKEIQKAGGGMGLLSLLFTDTGLNDLKLKDKNKDENKDNDNDDENLKHIVLEMDDKDIEEEIKNMDNEMKQIIKGNLYEKISIESEKEAKESRKEALKNDLKEIQEDILEEKVQKLQYSPPKLQSKEYEQYKDIEDIINKDSEIKIEITPEQYQKIPKVFNEFLLARNWEEYLKILRNLFIENAILFKEDIFKTYNKHLLSVFLVLLKYNLLQINENERLEKLTEINTFYPELFKTKTHGKYLALFGTDVTDSFFSFLGFNKIEDNETYKLLGKELLSKQNELKKTIKLTELFPEFVNDPEFCSVIKKSKNILDIIYLLPYLENITCEIDWVNKLYEIADEPINKDQKDEFILLFLLSLPDPNIVVELLQKYRRRYYNFQILNNLLNILNFDKRFIEKINNKDIVEKFETKIDNLRQNDKIYDELWLWIIQYSIKFDIKEKQYYFNVLNNYFKLINDIYQEKCEKKKIKLFCDTIKFKELNTNNNSTIKKITNKIKSKKNLKDINDIFIIQNLKFIIENSSKINNNIDPILLFVKFVNTYQKYFNNLLNDPFFNVEIYNLIIDNKLQTKQLKIKTENINESNLQNLIKIKFQSIMKNKLNSNEYITEIKKIENIKNSKDIKLLLTKFFIRIRNEYNKGQFQNILYFDSLRLEPENIFSQILFILHEKEKNKEEEEKKKEQEKLISLENKNFVKKSLRNKIQTIKQEINKNEDKIKDLDVNIEIIKNKKELKGDSFDNPIIINDDDEFIYPHLIKKEKK